MARSSNVTLSNSEYKNLLQRGGPELVAELLEKRASKKGTAVKDRVLFQAAAALVLRSVDSGDVNIQIDATANAVEAVELLS